MLLPLVAPDGNMEPRAGESAVRHAASLRLLHNVHMMAEKEWCNMLLVLPRIRKLHFDLHDYQAHEWEDFLSEAAPSIKEIPSFKFEISISQSAGTPICQGRLPGNERLWCIGTYEPALQRQSLLVKNRSVRWEFGGEVSDYARCHCVLGTLCDIVER
jgi:hypothetical protein